MRCSTSIDYAQLFLEVEIILYVNATLANDIVSVY